MLHKFRFLFNLNARGCSICSIRSVRAFLGCLSAPTFCPGAGQRTFASAERCEFALSLTQCIAGRTGSLEHPRACRKGVLSTGDPTEDSDARAGFIVKYEEMHRFVIEPTERHAGCWAKTGRFRFPCEPPRHVVFRHRRGERRDRYPALGKELCGHDGCRELRPSAKTYFAAPPVTSPSNSPELVSDEGRHNGVLAWRKR